MGAKILVTGVTGNVGFEVAKELLKRGEPVRLGDIHTGRIYERFGQDVDAAAFAFGQDATYTAALAGIEKVFLMRPPQITDVKKYMFPAIDAALAAGVKQFVFLSLIGIEHNRIVPHYAVEQRLRECGRDWTFLRASFFMQNFNTTHRAEIRDRGEIGVPVGKGRTSFIDVRDIGAVAAVTLSEPGHENQAYDLTGPQALDYYQAAETFSEVLGRKIRYTNPSLPGFVLRTVRSGIRLPFALVMAGLYTSTRLGLAKEVTGEVRRLLGREPRTLREYIVDYQDCWN